MVSEVGKSSVRFKGFLSSSLEGSPRFVGRRLPGNKDRAQTNANGNVAGQAALWYSRGLKNY